MLKIAHILPTKMFVYILCLRKNRNISLCIVIRFWCSTTDLLRWGKTSSTSLFKCFLLYQTALEARANWAPLRLQRALAVNAAVRSLHQSSMLTLSWQTAARLFAQFKTSDKYHTPNVSVWDAAVTCTTTFAKPYDGIETLWHQVNLGRLIRDSPPWIYWKTCGRL